MLMLARARGALGSGAPGAAQDGRERHAPARAPRARQDGQRVQLCGAHARGQGVAQRRGRRLPAQGGAQGGAGGDVPRVHQGGGGPHAGRARARHRRPSRLEGLDRAT
eukprot:919033-Prymnesium_polylepis.2